MFLSHHGTDEAVVERIAECLRGEGIQVVLTGVYGVAFSPDGQRIASAGLDGRVRMQECEVRGPIEEVLALAKERSKRELTCEERQTFLHERCRS